MDTPSYLLPNILIEGQLSENLIKIFIYQFEDSVSRFSSVQHIYYSVTKAHEKFRNL